MQITSKELAVVILFLFLLTPVVWKSISQSRIAIVDMKRVLNQPAVLLSRSEMPEKDQTLLLIKYSAVLPEVLANYGKIYHVTLISAPVIVSGSLDITDTIIEQTFERLKHE